MERRYKIGIGIIIIVILTLGWYLKPYKPMDSVEKVFEVEDQIGVIDKEWLVFKPTNKEMDTGLIFYPGAKVKPKSYAPLAKEIAKSGYLVVIVPMPLNLAVLAVNSADEIINKELSIERWIMGGHSLGGAMAARYTYNNINKISGLILLASYPAENNDLSNKRVKVLSIYGDKDGITSMTKINESKEFLSQNTQWVKIEGGNHSQFGWYGFQSGDKQASISREKQQSVILNSIREFLLSFPCE